MAKAAGKKDLLENLTSNYSTEVLKLAASQMELTKEQATAIFVAKGLKDEQLAQAVATATLSTTQKKATTSTLGLGAAFKGLGTTLKSLVLAHPILTALAAIGLLTAAYVKWGDTVKNASKKAKESLEDYQKTVEEIKSLNDELDTTASKIDELNAKENLTLVEIDELERLRETNDELERELSIRKALEEQQGKKSNDDAVEYFNKNTKDIYGGVVKFSGSSLDIVEQQLAEIKELEEYFKTAVDPTTGNTKYLHTYFPNKQELERLKSEVAKTIETFMESDDGLIEGMDDGILSRLNEIYDKFAESTGNFGQAQTDKISGILEKVDFQKYNDLLLKMGEDGKLSVSELSSRFPDLISYLQEAGVSAEELYKYIMSLSNPDAINYDEVRKQLMESVGVDGNVDSAYEAKLLDKLNKSGLTGNEGLEAYLQVKARYTDGQTEFWSIDDWISNIQAEMSTLEESNETPILSVSDTIDQLNTQLRPTLESLGKAYQDIFTTEDGKEIFTPENVDISMLSDIKSAIEEINEIDGIDIDISSFEDLANVLTDSSSTAGDVKTSFNDLANTIIYATDCTNMSSDTFNVLSKSLESMGLTNADKILHNIAQAQEEITAQGYTLADITAEQAKQFINEGKASAIATEYLQMYMIQKQLADYPLNTLNDVAALESLCNALGVTGELLKAVISLKSALGAVDSGAPIQAFQSQIDSANAKIADLAASGGSFKFNFDGAGKASAGKAGKEAADEYVRQFEESLSELDRLKEIGILSEKGYLDELRKLYNRFYRDKEKYLKNYQNMESKYLQGMKSLYESAFSYITKQIDKRIDSIQKQRDSQIESMEAQKKAVEEFYQSQIDEIDEQIDGIDKEIKSKQELIDAINDAADARQREIDLQKAQYDLERMQNQNTKLVYKDGQMSYEADTTGIREAREEVEDKKRDIEIATIEKVIDGLEKQKDILDERKEALQKALDASNAYWDAEIEKSEKHFDSIISNLEETKNKFTELSEVFENAQMEATLQELGINMEALLNGSTEEFDKLKNSYVGILADMGRGNDEVISQLSKLAGVNAESVSYLESTKGAFENLGETTLDPLSTSVEDTASATEGLSTSASEASTAVGDIGTNASETTASITPLNDELQKLKDLLAELTILFDSLEFPTPGDEGYAQKLEAIATAFGNIATKCKEFEQIDFSSIIGTNGEGSGLSEEGSTGSGFSGLATAISDAVTTIDEQMNSLTTALQIGNDAFAEQIGFITDEYIPAWEELQTRLAEIIGVGGSGDNKKDKKDVSSMKTGSTDGESSSGDNIIGIMQIGGEEVSAKLQDPWLKSFNEFATGENSIQSIAELIKEIVTEMASSIQSQCEAAAKAIDNLAEKALSASVSVGGSGYSGKAYASGTSGLPRDEKNALVGEVAPELVVDPESGQYSIFTTPTITDLNKGTIVYDGEDTKKILSGKGNVSGNAYAEGTTSRPYITPINYADPRNENLRKFNEYMEKNSKSILDMASAIKNPMNEIADSVTKISSHVVNNTRNQTVNPTFNITMPNVTNSTAAESLANDLQSLVTKKYQFFNQR